MTKRRLAPVSLLLLLASTPLWADGPLVFFSLSPCRLIDTRSTSAPALQGKTSRDFQVQGRCGVPVNAKAAALNATIIAPQSDGYITLFPSGTAWPGTANLTFKAGVAALSNSAIVPLSTNANDMTVYLFQSLVTQTANLVVDAGGYYCKVDTNGNCIP